MVHVLMEIESFYGLLFTSSLFYTALTASIGLLYSRNQMTENYSAENVNWVISDICTGNGQMIGTGIFPKTEKVSTFQKTLRLITN